jgi:hypothetical protein
MNTSLHLRLSLLLVFLCLTPAYPLRADVIYVDASATGANNGSSWADAYNYLQDALTAAGSGTEIWVTQGTYRPDMDTAHPGGTNDRYATFQLKNGVSIYGGFPTGGGSRDPNTYVTFLSGDIGVADNKNDNSYHVVNGSGTNSTAILDGFTITKGYANDNGVGGGMYNGNSSPTLTNCIFSGNEASGSDHGSGGGMFNSSSSPTLTNCTFIGNKVYGSMWHGLGGGMCNYGGSPTLINCTFAGNEASGGDRGGYGGGMYNDGSNPNITNCTFTGNSTSGGILNDAGGGMCNYGSSPNITNCTFTGNSSLNVGGGMSNEFSSSPIVTNCILWGNTAPYGGSQISNSSSTVTVSFSDIQGGYSGTGNINADPLFVDANGPDNIAGTEDDNLRLSPGSPCIDTANNVAVPIGIETDLDGRDRFADGDCNTTVIVDMGAFEFTYTYFGDFDSDCDIDFIDFAIQANFWLTDEFLVDIAPTPASNGIVDTSDLVILCDNWLESF